MIPVRLTKLAMATQFEVIAYAARPELARAAIEEAFEEIDRIENQLTIYRPNSQIAQVNARAAREPVRVEPRVFHLLAHAQRLALLTEGTFDITIAPLLRCWGFVGGSGTLPTPEAVAEARQNVGINGLELDPDRFTVRFTKPDMMIDLGAIGKGYAVEHVQELLRDAGIESAMVHGGTSTVATIGTPPDAASWKVAIEAPAAGSVEAPRSGADANPPDATNAPTFITVVELKDEALSVSAVWGKSFQTQDVRYGHVLDPRSAQPVQGALESAVVLPSATETDALSTALLVLGEQGLSLLHQLRPNWRGLVVVPDPPGDTSTPAEARPTWRAIRHGC